MELKLVFLPESYRRPVVFHISSSLFERADLHLGDVIISCSVGDSLEVVNMGFVKLSWDVFSEERNFVVVDISPKVASG